MIHVVSLKTAAHVRWLVLQLLLLAVLFNALVGMPLHAASHLASPVGTALVATGEVPAHAPDDADHHRELHAACAVCVAQAQQGHALAPSVSLSLGEHFAIPFSPHPTDFFVPETRPWVYKARGPPASAT